MPGPTPSQPGWYDDGDGSVRWYDGTAWTDHVQGEDPAVVEDAHDDAHTVVVPQADPGTQELPTYGAPQPGPVPYPVGSGDRRVRIAVAVGAVLILIGLVAVLALVVLADDDDDAADDDGTDPSTTTSITESPSAPTSDETLDIPTINPSDFPTLDPSDFPSIPDLPSGLPTGFPTDFPSTFPTDPSGWESWLSDQIEQVDP